MIRPLDLADPDIAQRLVDIQRAAYAVEARLIGVPSLPPMTETAAELAATGLSALGAVDARAGVVGFVAYELEGRTLDVHRLAVDPPHSRRGHGGRLLDALRAAHPDVRRTTVGTSVANLPALALYGARGFVPVEERLVGDGIRWVQLELVLPSAP